MSTFLTFMERPCIRLDTEWRLFLQMFLRKRLSEEVKGTRVRWDSRTLSFVAYVIDTVSVSVSLLKKFQVNNSWCLRQPIANTPTAWPLSLRHRNETESDEHAS